MRGSGQRQRQRQRPAVASVGAGIALSLAALAALALTCAGCSHILPLGPAPAAPRHLGSAVTLQLVLIQPPSPAGGCPAGFAAFSAPFADYPQVPDACYRKTGKPVTITTAAVAMSYQPAQTSSPPCTDSI